MPERIQRLMRSGPVAIAIAVSICTQLLTTSIFVYVSSQARQDICTKVEHAFEDYTTALASTFAGDQEPSERLLEAEAHLRSTFDDEFDDCG